MKKSIIPGHHRTFETMKQSEVPQSRNGKHRKIVTTILEELEELAEGNALKVPLKALADTKENVRAALSRESKKRRLVVATAADGEYLYVWAGKAKP